MLIREAIASIIATVVLLLSIAVFFYVPDESGPNNSWQRGLVIVPFMFMLTVPVLWMSGRYLIAKGQRTPFLFCFGAFKLASGIVAVLVTPSIVLGGVVGLFSWISGTIGALVFMLLLSITSIPVSLIWWLVVEHNKSFKPTALRAAA